MGSSGARMIHGINMHTSKMRVTCRHVRFAEKTARSLTAATRHVAQLPCNWRPLQASRNWCSVKSSMVVINNHFMATGLLTITTKLASYAVSFSSFLFYRRCSKNALKKEQQCLLILNSFSRMVMLPQRARIMHAQALITSLSQWI